jgi:predicted permease
MDAYVADLVRSGVSLDEARRKARLEFGSVELAREECREARGVRWADELAQNLRYAWRTMRRAPGFAAAAMLSLALGIGVNTAIFSLMDAVLLRSLPVFEPDRLMLIGHGRPKVQLSSNYGLLEAYRAETPDVFSGVTAASESGYKVDTGAGVEIVSGQMASGNFHAVLGVPMALGRGFVADNDRMTNAYAVISYRYWTLRFANDPNVLGRTLYVNGNPTTLIGVTGREFFDITPGRPVDITISMSLAPKLKSADYFTTRNDWISLTLVGRLRSGISPERAETVVNGVFQRYIDEPASRWVKQTPNESFHAARLQPAAKGIDDLRRKFSTPLWVLFGIVVLVLIVACANTSSLLLARATARQKEVAVRLALGVSRAGLVRQLLTESLCLAAAGGALGAVLAVWTTHVLLTLLASGSSPVQIDASPNLRILAFTAAVSILCGIVFGLAPTMQALRVDTNTTLKGGSQGTRFAAGKMIVATQVAVCFLLLTAAGLLIRTFQKLQNVELGFERHNLVLANLDADGTSLTEQDAAPAFAEVRQRLASLPGVRSASLSDTSPISTSGNQRRFQVPGYSSPKPEALWASEVSPDYFATFGIPIENGRDFDESDAAGRPRTAIVNESMVRRYFHGKDPIGRYFYFGTGTDKPLQIVGVVSDAIQFDPRVPAMPTAYTPLSQADEPSLRAVVAVRTTGDLRPVLSAIRKEVQAVNKQIAVHRMRTMPDQLNEILLNENLLARLSGFFAVLAAVLACIGLYGVMAYTVARRTREMGVRVALGATAVSVRWLVIRQAMTVVAAGVAIGLPAAYFASPVLSDLLFNVAPADPMTYAAVAALLACVGLAAAYLPARSASQINPIGALRIE